MHKIVMEITLLIMENVDQGKIMELCFLISVGTLYYILFSPSDKCV